MVGHGGRDRRRRHGVLEHACDAGAGDSATRLTANKDDDTSDAAACRDNRARRDGNRARRDGNRARRDGNRAGRDGNRPGGDADNGGDPGPGNAGRAEDADWLCPARRSARFNPAVQGQGR
jgi:hypothetical protein